MTVSDMSGDTEQILLDFYTRNPSESSRRKNFNPKVWGPPAWTFLDHVIQSYPRVAGKQDRKIMSNFLMALGHALPCHNCRINYQAFVKQYPPVHNVSGKAALQRWFDTYRKTHT